MLKQFRHFLGISPLAHLHRLRLTAARAELLRSDGGVSISDVASCCGFTHPGRFASDYRRVFGEQPSETRRRANQISGNGADFPDDARTGLALPIAGRETPSLLILPLRSETLDERRAAQELIEQVAVALTRMRVASVSFADPTAAISRNVSWTHLRSARAEYCLTGRLARHRDRLRVALWLTGAGGYHLWGDCYDGSFDGMFELAQRVVEGCLSGVVAGIIGAEIQRIRGKRPTTLTARELVISELPLLLKIDVASSRKALAVANRAMEIDPDDALPVAFAAYCQARLSVCHGTTSPAVARDIALRLERRAGSLDSNDPLVTTARAAVATLLEQRDDAQSLVTRALAMDPTSGWTWERRGFARLFCWNDTELACRDDADLAIADFHRALQLYGPFMPRENCLLGIAVAHRGAGRLEEAVRWVHRALAENPRAAFLHRFLVFYHSRLGDQSAARRSSDELRRAHPELTMSLLAEIFPANQPECLELMVHAGVPL